MTKQLFKEQARRILEPVVGALGALGVPPILVTLFGVVFSLYGAVVVADGSLFQGAIFLLLSGLCDVLDGDLARRRDRASAFGAFIDSTLDRVTEFAYFTGIVLYIVNRPAGFNDFQVTIVLVALAGSVLTSYARARAEGIGVECQVGLLERPERILLLVVGLLLGFRVLMIVVGILAVASLITFVQRIFHVHRAARNRATLDESPPEPVPGEESTPHEV